MWPSCPMGDRVVSLCYGTLKVWNWAEGICERTIEVHDGDADVDCVVVLPGGDKVVSADSDYTLKVWRLADGSCETTLEGHEGEVCSVAVLPGGDRVVSASADGTLKVWRLSDGACENTLEGHRTSVSCVIAP